MCFLVFASRLSEEENKRRMAKIYCKGTQGKRRVNGSICELKVNPRQNQQRESRARPPTQIFKEGHTELGNCYILNQGLFYPTFYGGKRNSHTQMYCCEEAHMFFYHWMQTTPFKEGHLQKSARSLGWLYTNISHMLI